MSCWKKVILPSLTQTMIIPKVLLETSGKIKTSLCIRNILRDSLQPLIGLFLISQLKVF